MAFLKRNCPACGNKALPVLSRSRKKIRHCTHCAAEFREYTGTGCLIYPIILILGIGSLYLGRYVPEAVAKTDVLPFIVLVFFILGIIVPGYFLNATIPLKLSKDQSTEKLELPFKNKNYQFPIVLVVLLFFVMLSIHACNESFFPKQLRELAEKRENQLSSFRNVLLAYKEKFGCYPETLDLLVPDYVDSIPAAINPKTSWDNKLYAIHYFTQNCEANFHWSRCVGPDCGSRFVVDIDEFWHDM